MNPEASWNPTQRNRSGAHSRSIESSHKSCGEMNKSNNGAVVQKNAQKCGDLLVSKRKQREFSSSFLSDPAFTNPQLGGAAGSAARRIAVAVRRIGCSRPRGRPGVAIYLPAARVTPAAGTLRTGYRGRCRKASRRTVRNILPSNQAYSRIERRGRSPVPVDPGRNENDGSDRREAETGLGLPDAMKDYPPGSPGVSLDGEFDPGSG